MSFGTFLMSLRRGVGRDELLEECIKKPYKGGKMFEVKGREGSFQINQHPTGFDASADDIIFSTDPGV